MELAILGQAPGSRQILGVRLLLSPHLGGRESLLTTRRDFTSEGAPLNLLVLSSSLRSPTGFQLL